MNEILIISSFFIQGLSIVMVMYTFLKISETKFPELDAMEKYHLMRNRYNHLRNSLLFVVALIFVQFVGLIYYVMFPGGAITLAQLLVSDAVFVGLVLFLTGIYKERTHINDIELEKEPEKKKK